MFLTTLCSAQKNSSSLLSNNDSITFQLALDLDREAFHDRSAIEFRRLAASITNSHYKAGHYWAAAYEYFKAGNIKLSEKMLDLTEDTSSELNQHAILLRGENALSLGNWNEACFFMESILNSNPSEELKLLSSRKMAGSYLHKKQLEKVREALLKVPERNIKELAECKKYASGHDRTPWLGGVLGIIPGLGYAYSGEYANALRSFILNGIFIYGLVDTADHEQWGGFTAIAFFELTWYTGSIYGGIDAAHRYNQKRLNDCLEKIEGETSFFPDLSKIPIVSLKFEF
ncbi:tol-pal system YbgF family protein [Verrucomicrobiota bacterium]